MSIKHSARAFAPGVVTSRSCDAQIARTYGSRDPLRLIKALHSYETHRRFSRIDFGRKKRASDLSAKPNSFFHNPEIMQAVAYGISNTLVSQITFRLTRDWEGKDAKGDTCYSSWRNADHVTELHNHRSSTKRGAAYIQGLITGLNNNNYSIGSTGSYIIDYRICPGSKLDSFIASLHLLCAMACEVCVRADVAIK
jgi:hypothetical protein